MTLILASVFVGVAAGAAVPAATPPAPNATSAAPAAPALVAVYPNPVLADDRGEFVVVAVAPGTDLGGLTVTDGETALALPDRSASGRLTVATDPVVRDLTDDPVVVVPGVLRLANGGERVELRRDGRVLDAVTFPRAPEGAVYRRTPSGWAWRRLGATSFPVRTARDVPARLFVLPDAPGVALDVLRSADRRLWLAGYTLTSARVADALCGAAVRGVDTRVLVELEPVGGMAVSQARLLDRLAGCGVAVRVVGGPGGRYTFHHAKYAVADDRAVVMTENWKPSGVGGRSSRGWGVVVASPDVADALAATFAADAGWRDARPWLAVREVRRFSRVEAPANATYPAVYTPVAVSGVDVEVVVAPDHAEARVVALLDGADESIRAVQVSVGGPDQPFVRALLRAARRGVSVRLLLADAWYVRDHNREVAETLTDAAREEGIPLRVRLAAPRGRYEKIHAKAAVVDDEHVLIGSLNWNNVSARENREVALVLHGEAAARYYARAFDGDWRGGRWRLPVGLVAAAAVLGLVAGGFAVRTIEFDPGREAAVRPGEPDGVVAEVDPDREVPTGPW